MNKQPTFSYIGPPTYFSGTSIGHDSLAVLTRNLILGLRSLNHPAFSVHQRLSPYFYEGRHLLRELPPLSLEHCEDFNFVDSGWMAHTTAHAIYAKQRLVITSIDDFRWTYEHIQRSWEDSTILTFSKYSQEQLSKHFSAVGYFPLGVNRRLFYPDKPLTRIPPYTWSNFQLKDFPNCKIYLSVSYPQERKGIQSLLDSFHQAFRGMPVLLWIHGRTDLWGNGRNYLDYAKKLFNTKSSPMILWTEDDFGPDYLRQMYNTADYLVSPHQLEGFGLPLLEAIACGTPVISTSFSGPMDFVNQTNCLLVDGKLVYRKINNKRIEFCEPTNLTAVLDASHGLGKQYFKCRGTERFTWRNSAKVFSSYLTTSGKIRRPHKSGVTILVPCKLSHEDLKQFLTTLYSIPAGMPFKVIVTNDGNSQEVKWVCDMFPEVIHIPIPKDIGINYSRNKLISLVNTKHFILFDCDILLSETGWLNLWYHDHLKHSCTASTILQLNPDGTVNAAGNGFDGGPPDHNSLPSTQLLLPRRIPHIQGSALMGNTEVFQLYPFDESFLLYWDESDLWTYFKYNHIDLHYLPSCRVIHNKHSSIRSGGLFGRTYDECYKLGVDNYNSYWQAALPSTAPAL